MKDKERICPACGEKCKYKGNRRFYCKKCKKTYDILRLVKPSSKGTLPVDVPFTQNLFTQR